MDATQIVQPVPDSQFRLIPCSCGSTTVAYARRITMPGGVEWAVRCNTCEKTTRWWRVQHHAQIEWNGGKRPTWERD